MTTEQKSKIVSLRKAGYELSPPIERLRIVSDEEFDCCEALVKGRAPERPEKPVEPIQQGSRNLLTGLIFCGYCGNRLCYSHNKTHRKLADGTEKFYDRHLYRCYRRISSPTSCEGPSAYEMDPINEAVEVAVRDCSRHDPLLCQLSQGNQPLPG